MTTKKVSYTMEFARTIIVPNGGGLNDRRYHKGKVYATGISQHEFDMFIKKDTVGYNYGFGETDYFSVSKDMRIVKVTKITTTKTEVITLKNKSNDKI